jgi:hypothetical protein
MASKIAEKTLNVSNSVPNARERVSAQFGQINDLVSGDWDTSTPASIQEALNRLAAAFTLLLAKLDADAADTTLDDTDYEDVCKP